MNCEQAKQLPIMDYFSSIGMQPEKVRGNEYWYKSPFVREQQTGSLQLSKHKNYWYCYNIGRGGNVLDFVMLLHSCDLPTALQIIAKQVPTNTFLFVKQNTSIEQAKEQTSGLQIEKVKVLENKALVSYLESRHIPLHFARKYVQECYYKINSSQTKPYFALYFENDKLGGELRNKHFKGSTTPKTITTIKGRDSSKVCIFEGFIDFLTALVHFKKPYCEYDVIVLNSVSNLPQLLTVPTNLAKYQAIKLYLDNDDAGKQATNLIQSKYTNVVDYSFLYADYKDFNEMLVSKKQNPFEKP